MKRLIEDDAGNIYPIARLFDIEGNDTDDLAKVESLVVETPDGYDAILADPFSIHTVH